ncbi:YebC/PmpR family DNA-binding transcriptional regulator [Mycoplasmoides genitalium]
MPRKHLIANQTNKKQQTSAKQLQKLAKRIASAVKKGGTNIQSNPHLKVAVDLALAKGLSMDSIKRNIHGSEKDTTKISEFCYEIFGPNGVGIIVFGLTDNPNRLLSSLNGYLAKLKGQLAKPNSVKINFQEEGIIFVNKNNYLKDDLIELLILDNINLIDVDYDEECFEISLHSNSYFHAKELLKKNNFSIVDSEIKLVPLLTVDLDKNQQTLLSRFLNACEEDDDIQFVVHNANPWEE